MILRGKVVAGQKIAHEFGVATANLEIFAGKLEENGVYIVECFLENSVKSLPAVMHYGKRKTTDGEFSVEVHLLDFSRDLYDEELEVRVLQKIREIQKFDSVELLFAQIKNDIIKTRKFFLRRDIKGIWKKMDTKSREIFAERALAKVSKLPDFLSAKNVFIYAPKGDEIDFVEELCAEFPDKNYYFPKIIEGEMKFFSAKFNELKVGKWGIREPSTPSNSPLSGGEQIEPNLIFVPAVGADFAGNRLGNGGGFYDKFLAKISREIPPLAGEVRRGGKVNKKQPPLAPPCQGEKVKTICVLPEFAVFHEIPVEEWDEKVEVLVV